MRLSWEREGRVLIPAWHAVLLGPIAGNDTTCCKGKVLESGIKTSRFSLFNLVFIFSHVFGPKAYLVLGTLSALLGK